MIIERCNARHFDGWVRLRCLLWPDQTIEAHRKYAGATIDRPENATVYIAREGDTVIGFAEATMRRDYVNGCSTSPVGFLEGLFVEKTYRGRGIARLLNDALEQWAAGFGCTEFASDVLLDNTVGQKAHEALGYKETERVVFYAKRLVRAKFTDRMKS